jgi:hypothetical protein
MTEKEKSMCLIDTYKEKGKHPRIAITGRKLPVNHGSSASFFSLRKTSDFIQDHGTLYL